MCVKCLNFYHIIFMLILYYWCYYSIFMITLLLALIKEIHRIQNVMSWFCIKWPLIILDQDQGIQVILAIISFSHFTPNTPAMVQPHHPSLMMTELEQHQQHLEHNQYNVPTVHTGYYISVLPCLMKSNLITNPPTLQSTVMCHRQPYNSCRLVREPRDCDNNLALTALQPPVSSRYLLSPDLLYFKSFNSNPTSISTQPPTSFPTRLQLTFSHSSELHFTKRPFRI